MTLPEIKHPTYFLKLPSSGKEVKFRPFLVKEEKILLLAAQENDTKVALEAIKNIINNCTYGVLNVDQLPIFDVEWIFLQLRIKSKGHDLKLKYNCNNIPDGKTEPCNTEITISLNLEELEVVFDPKHSKKIMITDTIGLVMKYPTLDIADELEKFLEDQKNMLSILATLVDSVFDGDVVTDASTVKQEDMVAWLETMTEDAFDNIQTFFETYPRISKTITLTCPTCGNTEEITIEGLQNFLF